MKKNQRDIQLLAEKIQEEVKQWSEQDDQIKDDQFIMILSAYPGEKDGDKGMVGWTFLGGDKRLALKILVDAMEKDSGVKALVQKAAKIHKRANKTMTTIAKKVRESYSHLDKAVGILGFPVPEKGEPLESWISRIKESTPPEMHPMLDDAYNQTMAKKAQHENQS